MQLEFRVLFQRDGSSSKPKHLIYILDDVIDPSITIENQYKLI
jgi:hypothetical protein